MRKLSKIEYFAEFPEASKIEEFMYAKYFYISDNKECPYMGVEYEDGSIWIYGGRVDSEIESVDDLEWYLSQS